MGTGGGTGSAPGAGGARSRGCPVLGSAGTLLGSPGSPALPLNPLVHPARLCSQRFREVLMSRSVRLSDRAVIFCFALLPCVPRGGWCQGHAGSYGQHRAPASTTRTNQNRVFPVGRDNDHLGQLPARFRAGQKAEHVIKGIVRMPLEHRQAWGIGCRSGKPAPGRWGVSCSPGRRRWTNRIQLPEE